MTDLRQRIADNVQLENRGHDTPCWVWQGTTHKGYGRLSINDKTARAHRTSYEAYIGAIPEGLVIDHLCRVTQCVNPAHLEPVSPRENVIRGRGPAMAGARMAAKTHCPQGHEYTPDNIIGLANGFRQCRICNRAVQARSRARKRHAASNPAPEGLCA